MLEEFFIQGDKKKELCITVHMLNDRDKVNRAFSQIGFIGRRLVADGNGLLDKEEFEDLIAEDYVFEVMEVLGVHFPKQDLQEFSTSWTSMRAASSLSRSSSRACAGCSPS